MAKAFASDDELGEPHAIELRRGTRLGRYELLLPIAKGGMARVWAARQHGQRGFTKLVAIKTILPHLAREAEFERMFLDEARIASLVHHPNVCEIYELGDDAGVLYLAMEWVSGDSLMHVLRGRGRVEAIDLRVAARIVADAAAGLHAAHELTDDDNQPMNVVHRDVSPHNVLISSDGHVKVADFGVAKALGQMHSATIAGQIKGKIAYMAPEQITSTKFDRRADVFALGCILYEVTTGLQPFLGDSDPQVMHAIMKGDYVLPSKLMVGYPHELEGIIQKALAPDPKDRFATADQMKLAIEQWIAASGQLVTTSHVAALVRERLGPVLDKRREKIKDASQQQTNESGNIPRDPSVAVAGATPGGAAGPSVAPGSTSGVREQQRPRNPSHPSFGPNASGSYPNQAGGISAPGTPQPSILPDSGSGSGQKPLSIAPPSPDASGGHPRQQSSADFPQGLVGPQQAATNYGQTSFVPQPAAQGFNPLQPFANTTPGSPMRYVIAIALGIAVALFAALVIVVIMGVTKHSGTSSTSSAGPAQSVAAQTPDLRAPAEPQPSAQPAQPPVALTAAAPVVTAAPAQTTQPAPASSPTSQATAKAESENKPAPQHASTPPAPHRPTPLPMPNQLSEDNSN